MSTKPQHLLIKLYQEELGNLLSDKEKANQISKDFGQALLPIMNDASKHGVLGEMSPEDATRLAVYNLNPTSLENMSRILFLPDFSQIPSSPDIPRDRQQLGYTYLALPVHRWLIEYLHKQIDGFPSSQDFNAILEFLKESEKLPAKEKEPIESMFKSYVKNHYKVSKETPVEIEPFKRITRTVNRVYKAKIKKGEKFIGPSDIMPLLARLEKEPNAFAAQKAWDIEFDEENMRIYRESRALWSSYHLLKQLLQEEKILSLSDLKDKHILDLGCGVQSPAMDAFKELNIPAKFVGFDFCSKALEACKEMFPNHSYVYGIYPYDLLSLLPKNSFDVIFAINALHKGYNNRIEKWPTLVAVDQMLKKGGKFIAIEPRSKEVDHLEMQQYFESMGYIPDEILRKIKWPEDQITWHLILVTQKTKEEERDKSYKLGLALSYLKAGPEHLKQALKLAEELRWNFNDLREEVEYLEGIDVMQPATVAMRILQPGAEKQVVSQLQRLSGAECSTAYVKAVLNEFRRCRKGLSYKRHWEIFKKVAVDYSEENPELFLRITQKRLLTPDKEGFTLNPTYVPILTEYIKVPRLRIL
jgi:ubiquinone/menaquinone biosynthesis C-methylase UbiE